MKVALLNVGNGVGFYAAFVYAVTYIRDIDKLPESVAFNLNTGAMALDAADHAHCGLGIGPGGAASRC